MTTKLCIDFCEKTGDAKESLALAGNPGFYLQLWPSHATLTLLICFYQSELKKTQSCFHGGFGRLVSTIHTALGLK